MIDACFAKLKPLIGTAGACRGSGKSRATHYRRCQPPKLGPRRPRGTPSNALSEAETAELLTLLRAPRFVDLAPAQVWAILLDEGRYVASISTMYRVLRANDEVRERRAQATHPTRARPELMADKPNMCWSWDIQCRHRHWMSYADRSTMPMLLAVCRLSDVPKSGRSA